MVFRLPLPLPRAQVCVLTHAYDDRGGVRHMTNGLKVYYAPRIPVYKVHTP